MYSEDDLLPLSALQHLAYCERQWGLIHLEQQWAENRLTAEGRQLHERVHEQQADSRGEVRIVRGLRIRSLALGLSGAADVVEFHRDASGAEVPYPVEYKHGRAKANAVDEVQLCAQALCLEEMLGRAVPRGAFFYAMPRRRTEVVIGDTLRTQTIALAAKLHRLQAEQRTPVAEYGPKCDRCSLAGVCAPKAVSNSVAAYMRRSLRAAQEGTCDI